MPAYEQTQWLEAMGQLPRKNMNTQDNWIKIELPFRESHFPCFVAAADTQQVHYWRTLREMQQCEPLWASYTHWKAAPSNALPAPPVKEITRDQKDFAIYNAWWTENAFSSKADSWPAWATALKKERAAIRAMLDKNDHDASLIWELRQRVKP